MKEELTTEAQRHREERKGIGDILAPGFLCF
jgi:hypothetical protein